MWTVRQRGFFFLSSLSKPPLHSLAEPKMTVCRDMVRTMGKVAKLFLCTFLFFTKTISSNHDTIIPGQSIEDGKTVISNDQSFELGFFSPGKNLTRRYLGMWFKKLASRTVVWVANRDTPLWDRSGVLTLTNQGVLVLQNRTNHVIWSSNGTTTSTSPIAQLLDSGNLVVRDVSDGYSSETYQWQSFDYPTDNLLAGMKLGVNFVTGSQRFLTSWKSPDDPARGDYTYGIDPRGFPQFVGKKGNSIAHRYGSWNGVRMVGAPNKRHNNLYTYEFVLNEQEVYYHFTLTNTSVPSRILLNELGIENRLLWMEKTVSWVIYYVFAADQCDNYAMCGENAVCNINSDPWCSCLEGFEPKSERDWSLQEWAGGCVRSAALGCDSGEGFVKYKGLKLPDTSGSWYDRSMSLGQCKEMCSNNCSCTAYANTDIRDGGSGCLLWFKELIDMREYTGAGQDVYIRMAASYLEDLKKQRKVGERKKIAIIVSSMVSFMGVLALGWVFYVRRRKLKCKDKMKKMIEMYHNTQRKEDVDLPIIDLASIVQATENFSSQNLLGKGGFGSVYKGTFSDGKEVAVKRLSMNSLQGLEEFINEVIVIAKLQHRNLVNLLGCCIERDERMLVYEYMPNKSLDNFIFDTLKSSEVTWQKRVNIIDGIARGLLYLHQDSRHRIIHRDLKASNVLLDSEMNPRISDFGMARMFSGNETEGNTRRVVGTYGYMAPEYAIHGNFSMKSDVFSFGVLVLEIVSGRKNRGSQSQHDELSLLEHAWKLWMEERMVEIIDERLGDWQCDLDEIVRCIQVGLLCVQHRPEDRPNMATVVLMLSGESLLPRPKQPGFSIRRNDPEGRPSSGSDKSASVNEISVTSLDPR